MLQDPPTVDATDAAQVIGTWRGHTLVIWAGTPTLKAAEAAARVIRRNVRLKPRRSAYFAMLRHGLDLPDAGFRQVFIQLGQDLRDELECIAVIIEGNGFVASALRGVVTGIGIAARLRYPLRCFASVEDAGEWVRTRLYRSGGSLGSPAELKVAFGLLAGAGGTVLPKRR